MISPDLSQNLIHLNICSVYYTETLKYNHQFSCISGVHYNIFVLLRETTDSVVYKCGKQAPQTKKMQYNHDSTIQQYCLPVKRN